MEVVESVVFMLVLVIVLVTYQAFRNKGFYEKYAFEVDAILVRKEYYRIISSSFIHVSWLHLIFNMIALYSFGTTLGELSGIKNFLLLFFISMIAGDLLALYVHRNHGDYRAVGASGAVSGVAFATIVLFPEMNISFAFIPVEINAWVFGFCYLLITIYGVKNQNSDIGHEAHLGGAIAGILTSIALHPRLLVIHPWVVISLLLPFTLFFILILKRPEVLFIENYWGISRKRNNLKKNKHSGKEYLSEDELNFLLEKVSKGGIDSLSKKEKERLEKISKQIN